WVIAGEDDHRQVRVSDHDVLPPRSARTGLATAEPTLPRLDRLDRAGPVGQDLQPHTIADDGQVGCLSLLLHPAAQTRLDDVARIGLDGVEAGAGATHEPARGAHPSAPTTLP